MLLTVEFLTLGIQKADSKHAPGISGSMQKTLTANAVRVFCMEHRRFELLTFCVRCNRSTN